MNPRDLKELLEELHDRYNCPEFIEYDPISIPHMFTDPKDREVAGFLASVIAWGNRKAIVKNGRRMMDLMDGSPYLFARDASPAERQRLGSFVHRTFNGADFTSFVDSVGNICRKNGSIGALVNRLWSEHGDMRKVLAEFRSEFFTIPHEHRCEKHLSSIEAGSACKRMNMYLRWMVRRDNRGVDFGLWTDIPASALYIPLDVHSGNVGRALGLLGRKQNDWKAVEELTASLVKFDPTDPVRYDFSLFGAGVAGYFK